MNCTWTRVTVTVVTVAAAVAAAVLIVVAFAIAIKVELQFRLVGADNFFFNLAPQLVQHAAGRIKRPTE